MTLAMGDVRSQSDTPVLPPRLARTAAVHVLAALVELAPPGGGAVALTVRELAGRARVTERTVQRSMRALEEIGAVAVEETRGGTSRFTVL
jgi:pyocin large subunit-like protein